MSDHSLDIQRLFSLQGKVALVTGGSRGIGYMISQGLLQAGARVYISARKAQACKDAAAELGQYGECVALPGDVSDPDSRRQLCEQLAAAEPRLDILVNNAGTAWGADYESFPESAFDKVMRVNVTAMFALTRDLTPLLEAAATPEDPARVINIGSMEGLHIPTVHGMGNYAYTTSKAAVHHLTRHLGADLAVDNINVNAIAPGFFPSKMTAHLLPHEAELAKGIPRGRLGREEDAAGTAIYLSSRASAWVTGNIICLDGGHVAAA